MLGRYQSPKLGTAIGEGVDVGAGTGVGDGATVGALCAGWLGAMFATSATLLVPLKSSSTDAGASPARILRACS